MCGGAEATVDEHDTTRRDPRLTDAARQTLRDDLDAIIRSVHVIAFNEGNGHPPEPTGPEADRALINLARAVAQAALPLAREFLSHDLPVECLEDLNHDIHELEVAVDSAPDTTVRR